jgi:hypothetical protein
MPEVTNYEVVITTYHSIIVARIRYAPDGSDEVFESVLYSIAEINNILTLWRMDRLFGSFGIGHKLAANATFQLMES